MTAQPEFSRRVRVDTLGGEARTLNLKADDAERAALAKRFELPAIERLSADVAITRSGERVTAKGKLRAAVTQSCVATELPIPAQVEEEFTILFRSEPDGEQTEEEIELSEAECDVIFYDGGAVDVGEAVAQTLALSLDPWPRAPEADEVLKAAGVKSEAEAGPFAALAALKDKLKP